jgi:hypothetical protein
MEKKYGVINGFQLESVKEKSKETVLKNFGVDNSMKSPIIQEKVKNTLLEKYGKEYTWNIEFVKEKSKKTKTERYNDIFFNNHNKTKQTKLKIYGNEYYNNIEKFKQTCNDRYGVDNPMQISETQQKLKESMMLLYGVEYSTQSDIIREQIRNTNLQKYGVENWSQTEDAKKKNSERMKKEVLAGNIEYFARNLYKLPNYNKFYKSQWEVMFQILNPDAKYESLRLPYLSPIDNSEHIYVTDFVQESNKTIYELKPRFRFNQCKDSNIVMAKIRAGIKYAKENGYKFKVLTETWWEANKHHLETMPATLQESFIPLPKKNK